MKYSTKLSDALHILMFIIVNDGKPITSSQLADSIKTNPACVRQIMALLKKDTLIESVVGQPRPSLSKNASEITLFDIYKAVEGNKPFLHVDMNTNQECNVGVYIQGVLQEYYNEVQKVADEKMKQITLQDIMDSYYKKVKPFISKAD